VSDAYRVAALDAPVEILIDRWGIPHIYAASARDAGFAQGFNAARDRLWQIDLWRRAGLGRLAEVLGPAYVERDRCARLFLFRGSLAEESDAYGCDLGEVLDPFVEGVNAYVRLVAARPELLPAEFELLGYAPSEWAPEDVLRIRAHGRYRNVRSEVARARILHRFGPAAEALRVRLEPDTALTVPDGLDLSLITADVLEAYELATAPPLSAAGARAASEGSNNWAVAGARTATGRPILANDPHRMLSLPSLRYLAHVVSPDGDVIGGGEPMLPGVSFGHNGRIAFGLTVLPIDHEDLYVYELDRAGGCRYRYRAGWEEMQVERQTIAVRGAPPVEVVLKFTRHGPVVHEAPARNAAFAVRAAWLEPGMVPYLGGPALLRARDWEGFRSAARHWGAPGENLVYADVEGNIGWQPAGRVPIRRNWDGLLPVPGDGRFEWDGFAAADSLPHELNPRRGWVATANQFNVAPSSTGGVNLSFEWEPPFRQCRIAEALEGEQRLSVAASAELQNDYLCLAAREVVPLLDELRSDDRRVRSAISLLQRWDGRLAADSVAAAVFELWFRGPLRRALFERALGDRLSRDEARQAVAAVMDDESVLADARIELELLRAGAASLQPELESSLREAMLTLERRLGGDLESRQWGRIHHAAFEHPLTELGFDLPRVGPAPRGGGCDTVGNTTYRADFLETVGATLRLVLDVGEWDRSVAMNSPGQSGDLSAPHAADLFARWAADESVPLVYTRAAVEAVTSRRLVLEPATAPAPPVTAAPGGAGAV
jgi:penicillin G amidase